MKKIDGDIVECGVWRGGCCMWMMQCQKKYSDDRSFYLYDTYNGMTFPDHEKDAQSARELYKQIATGEYKRGYDNWHSEKKWAFAPLEHVKDNVSIINYNSEKIKYVVGDVCETLNNTTPAQISILRLDTDWYNSTNKELTVLAPLVSKNGYIIIDDYYAWKGSHDATDDWLKLHSSEYKTIPLHLTGNIFVLQKL